MPRTDPPARLEARSTAAVRHAANSLVVRFALASLAVFLVVGVALHLVISRQVRDRAEEEASERAVFITRAVLQDLLEPEHARVPVTGDRYDDLRREVYERVLTDDVVRLKVWRPDGTIVFSDEPRLVGERFPEEESELAEVMAEGPKSELSDLGAEENVYERGLAKELFATYVPLRLGGSNVPVGVAELYQDYAPTAASASSALAELDVLMIAGLILLYLVLLPVASGVSRRLRQQATDLEVRSGELSDLADERSNLVSRLVRAQEEERIRIAQDIHDDSIQAVTEVALRMDGLRRRISDAEGLEAFDRTRGALTGALERMRRLLFELRPPSLDEVGLGAAFGTYLARVRREEGLEFTVDDRLTFNPSHEIRTIAYRIGQEALANVRKHARATRVDVTLEDADGGLRLRITDDGVGMEGAPPALADHLGVVSMYERAMDAGGWCRIEGRPGAGTTVEAWLPAPAPVSRRS